MAKPEAKIVSPVAKEVKAAAVAKARGPKGVEVTAKITLLTTSNPKRAGSKAQKRFELYKTGMTIDGALNAGLTTPDLIYDASHSFIKIDGYAPKLVPVKESKPAKAETTTKATGKTEIIK